LVRVLTRFPAAAYFGDAQILGESPPEAGFPDAIDEIPIEGFRRRENALFHRTRSTRVVADPVHKLGWAAHLWAAIDTRVTGSYDRPGLSYVIRWTGLDNRRTARRSRQELLACASDRAAVVEPLHAV
jgi:hypothetical protein